MGICYLESHRNEKLLLIHRYQVYCDASLLQDLEILFKDCLLWKRHINKISQIAVTSTFIIFGFQPFCYRKLMYILHSDQGP